MKPKVSEKEIIAALKDCYAGPVECGESVDAAQISIETRCQQLEEENRRLKLLVADLTLRNEALKLVAWKKW